VLVFVNCWILIMRCILLVYCVQWKKSYYLLTICWKWKFIFLPKLIRLFFYVHVTVHRNM